MKVCLQGKSCGMAANGCNCSQICPASSFLGLHPRWSPRALGAERTPPAMLRGRAPPTAPAAGAAPALSPPRRVPAPPPPPPPHHQELLPSLTNSQEQGQLRKRPFFLLSLFFSSLSRKRTALLCSVTCHKIKVLLEVTRESTLLLLLFSTVVRCSPNHRGIYSIFGLVPEEKAELFEKPVRTRRKRRSFQKICFGFCPTGTVHVGICLCRTKESN